MHTLGSADALYVAAAGEFTPTAVRFEGSRRIRFRSSLTLSTSRLTSNVLKVGGCGSSSAVVGAIVPGTVG